MRFKDIPVNSYMYGPFGGLTVKMKKINVNHVEINKINSPGIILQKIDPDLNQDDFSLMYDRN